MSLRILLGLIGRRWDRLILRGGVICACLAALTGISVPREEESIRRVYVLDLSRSYQRNESRAREAIEDGVAGLGPADRVGLVTFAARAETAAPMGPPADLVPLHTLSPPGSPGDTNLASGLQRALGLDPGGPPSQIVLFSDGQETAGNALAAAADARSAGVPIYPMDLGVADLPDLRLDRLRCPGSVRSGEPFRVEAVISSVRGGEATLLLRRSGGEPRERTVTLAPAAPRSLEFEDRIEEPRTYRYEAILSGLPAEANRANNRAGATIRVGQGMEVVALSRTPARVSPLGLLPGVRLVMQTPDASSPLAQADLILLDNLARDDLGEVRIDQISRAVRDSGAGLLVLGGRRSFGPGGYAGSGLDALLPVASDPEERGTAGISLSIVLDASGSMAEAVQGETKFRRAVKAILPIPSLGPSDRLEVITFREEPERVVPLKAVASQAEIREVLLGAVPGGGTRLFPALAQALEDLRGEGDRVRHVVVLSDGRSEEGDDVWEGWEAICRRHPETSTSVIAVGRDVDEARLREIARVGGGRYHRLPGITEALSDLFGQEVRIARGSLLREGEVVIEVEDGGGPLAGLGGPPPLFGFVATAPKDGATLFLRAGRYPILAGWRAGVGRVLAFPSALDTDWGRSWRTWKDLVGFLSQTMRWAARPNGLEDFDVNFSTRGEHVDLEVAARGEMGPRDGLRLLVSLGDEDPFPLRQIGSGLYRGRLPARPHGTSTVLLYEETQEGRRLLGALPRDLARRREMRDLGPKGSLLWQIAAMTGGRYGEGPLPDSAARRSSLRSLQPALLWIALALFLAEIALSGLPLTRPGR